jgi:hypothetical protein
MAQLITIDSFTGNTPFELYYCNYDGTGCVLVGTYSSTPIDFTVPSPLAEENYLIKIIDNDLCEVEKYVVNVSLTPTPTPTVTPSSTPLSTVYLSFCYNPNIPQDTFEIPLYFYADTVSGSCGSSPYVVQEQVSAYIEICDDTASCIQGTLTLYSGQSINCEASASLPGTTVTGGTFQFLIVPTGSTIANYVLNGICSSVSCISCPSPTPTQTPTNTPTVTPTNTNTPTVTPTVCVQLDYLLFNETASPLSWTALDCNGNGVGDTINGGQQANTGCIQLGTLSEGSLTIVSSTPC